MKRISILIICLLGILTIGISVPMVVSADSGWDNDYDSGSSSWSGSDWDSGSSWSDHDYSHSSSSGGSSRESTELEDTLTIVFIIILFLNILGFSIVRLLDKVASKKVKKLVVVFDKALIIACVIEILSVIIYGIYASLTDYYIQYKADPTIFKDTIYIIAGMIGIPILIVVFDSFIKKIKNKHNYQKNQSKKFTSAVRLSNENDIEVIKGEAANQLKADVYTNFVEIQEAWMNFDYDKLRDLCSSELYESYKSDLQILKRKSQKNIMKEFHYKDCSIVEVNETKKQKTIKAILYVSFKDYIIDTKTNKCIQGSKNKTFYNVYQLEFTSNKKVITKCPSCGSKIKGNECEYCHTVIDNNSSSLVLTNKQLIK